MRAENGAGPQPAIGMRHCGSSSPRTPVSIRVGALSQAFLEISLLMKKIWILLTAIIAIAATVSIAPVRSTAQKKKQNIHRASSPVPNQYIVTLSGDGLDSLAGEQDVAMH